MDTCPVCGVEQSEKTSQLMFNFGWECPKCGRVYAPICMACEACNTKIDMEEKNE